jgi:hypothetical protein
MKTSVAKVGILNVANRGPWSPAKVIVSVLLGEQALTAAIGIAGGLWPQRALGFLVGLIIGQLILNGLAIFFLVLGSGLRPSRPRAFAWCLGALVMAAIIKNLHVSPESSVIDLIRLTMPLLWVALIPDNIAGEFIRQVARWRMLLVVILTIQLAGLVAGRIAGWGGGYLSGDPLTGLLVFPAIVTGEWSSGSILTAVLVAPLLLGSLKRTAWVSIAVVMALLGVSALRGVSRPAIGRGVLLMLVGLVAVFAAVQLRDGGKQIDVRARSLAASLSQPSSDVSFGQRIDEVNVEWKRLEAAPVQTIIVGVSSERTRLPNGLSTHAIHNTPAFLLFWGGLIWLIALLIASRQSVTRSSPESWLLVIVGIGTLVDSLGGNTSLAPSFGFALAITLSRLKGTLIK